ncbi:hypothetical protein AAVH_14166 [Aphelenchoides avenae]|nr:hypothetical protein AAVH_14166 [Aphelenchus avenae]
MKSDGSWRFCGYTLKWTAERSGLDVANAFGISSVTDSLEGFDAMFAKHDARYEVLDLCIHEKYDLRGLSPKFTADGLGFVLRCACNHDLCNGDVRFQNQIAAAAENG